MYCRYSAGPNTLPKNRPQLKNGQELVVSSPAKFVLERSARRDYESVLYMSIYVARSFPHHDLQHFVHRSKYERVGESSYACRLLPLPGSARRPQGTSPAPWQQPSAARNDNIMRVKQRRRRKPGCRVSLRTGAAVALSSSANGRLFS